MTEDERAHGLIELEKKIGELITIINNSREEVPELEMKEIRLSLQEIKSKIRDGPGNLKRVELVATLEFTVTVLGKAMDDSRSKKLAEAHKQAFDLLTRFC
jgi:hypothetical protein